MPKLSSIWLQLISYLAEALLWFGFTLLFCYFFPHHFSCCFAWYLASHTQLSISPNTIIPSFPHSPTPSFHCTPNPCSPPITAAPDSWADSGVRSTRSMGGAAHTPSKLLLSDLPPGGGQARGLSAGIHPSPNLCGVRSVSSGESQSRIFEDPVNTW